LIREGDLFNGLLRFLAFPDNRRAFGVRNPIFNRSCYCPRASCAAMVMPGLRRGLADAAAVERAVRSAVNSNGSGMPSPSQHPLINCARRFPWDKKPRADPRQKKRHRLCEETARVYEAIRVSSVQRHTGTRFATFVAVCIGKPLYRVESTDFIGEVKPQSTEFAKEKEQV
jgi:hypothetical protein